MYLYRTDDSEGNTIDFYPSESRNKQAAKRFFKGVRTFSYVSKTHVITVDKNPVNPVVIQS